MDWLGSIAGIEEMLVKLLMFLFGSYAQFNVVIETITYFAEVKKCDHEHEMANKSEDDSHGHEHEGGDHGHSHGPVEETVEEELMNLSTFGRIGMYLYQKYKCFKICCRSKKILKLKTRL